MAYSRGLDVTQVAILYPVFVQVFLVYVVMTMMSFARRRSVVDRSPEKMKAIALGKFEWSDDAAKCAANYGNQFEIPVLFYAVVAFALIVKGADTIMIVLAWVFVLSRILHSYIHLGSNRIRVRMPVFAFGTVIVMSMWIRLMLHIALA